MLHATSGKGKQNRGRTRGVNYVGIISDAKTLGVDRTHLYRVLSGQRQSKSLLRRYYALKHRN